MTKVSLTILAFFLSVSFANSENWPQWRGPQGDGTGLAGQYPIEFSATKNVRWKVKLPGRGSSTPAVWQNMIFLTCAIDGQDGIVSYDFEGKELWSLLRPPMFWLSLSAS